MRSILITLVSSICVLGLGFGSLLIQLYPGLQSYTGISIAQADSPIQGGGDSGGITGGDSGAVRGGDSGSVNVNGVVPNDLQLRNPLKYGTLCEVLVAVLNMITQIGAVVAVILFVWVGFKFITAQGKPNEINEAKKAFFTTIIGTAVLLGASVIAQIVVKTIFSITNKSNPGVCNI